MENHIAAMFNEYILEEAGNRFGFNLEKIKELDGFENFIFEFKKDNKDFILRLSHESKRSSNLIQAEIDWINYLHDNGVACSKAYPSKYNKTVEMIGEYGNHFNGVIFDKVPGRHMRAFDASPELYEEYGRLIGQMHRLTKNYKPKSIDAKRLEWDKDPFYKSAETTLSSSHPEIIKKFNKLMEEIKTFPKSESSYGLIHSDVHGGNFFIDDGKIYVFDFDDSQYSWFINDIAIVIFYFAMNCPPDMKREDFITDFINNFMRGYNKENKLEDFWYEKIPYFLKLREFTLYLLIHRDFSDNDFDPWCMRYLEGRKEKLMNNIPYLDMDFNFMKNI